MSDSTVIYRTPAELISSAAVQMRATAKTATALAVAKWLDAQAKKAKDIDGYEDSAAYPLMVAGYEHPIAVARAFLGEGN